MRKLLKMALIAALCGCNADAAKTTTTNATDTSSVSTTNIDSTAEQSRQTNPSVISNSVSATFVLDGTIMNLRTGDMPKGWFTPQFSKSPIYVAWYALATACTDEVNGSFGSANTGSFTAVLNQGGHPVGYSWAAKQDLAGMENHWHNYVACNGTVTVMGCPEARQFNYKLSVGGACLSGGGTCTATGAVFLPAIQDADVIETNCVVDCEALMDACMSTCQSACTPGDFYCHSCCECHCKDSVNEGHDACPAPQNECYIDKPNEDHPACL